MEPVDVLAGIRVENHVVRDFAPLHDSLEWELARLAWARSGVGAFVRNEVPFLINNTGRLSEHVAALLFAAATAPDAPTGPIVVVEVGAGLGLFARYLLDAFKTICEQQGQPLYERFRLVVTDHAANTVARWQEIGLFDDHRGHVVLGTCDAERPESFRASWPASAPGDLQDVAAVICNYVLDVLPATVVRGQGAQLEELWVRSLLHADEGLLAQRTTLSAAQICQLGGSDRPEDRARLLPLLPVLDLEAGFRPVDATVAPIARQARTWYPDAQSVLVNHGAVNAATAWARRLRPDGFVLINDYGASAGAPLIPQRFGPTLAFGLNFDLLERALRAEGLVVDAVENDAERAVRARLVTRADRPALRAAFHNRFSVDGDRHFDLPVEDARRHAGAGRKSEALDSYRLALARTPRDWHLIGEIAEFVGLQLLDHASGIELARGALAINPWFSPWLWNVLGDCLFTGKRFDEAHDAYLAAQRIDADDARTNLNLAYTFWQRGEAAEALRVIARGLANDPRGLFRGRLLEKQGQILSAQTAAWAGDQERMLARLQRLG